VKFLNRLERRFGRYAIPNLMKYIVGIFILGLALGILPNNAMAYFLSLDFPSIMKGQVWRIITWIIPISSMQGILFWAISVYVYYIIGNALENTWGAFRFNLFFFTSILFNILSALITFMITGVSISPGLDFICGMMFFAFAATYPNMEFRLYFLIPIKAKYIAWLQGAIYIYTVFKYIVSGQAIMIIPLIVSFGSFLIFFFATRNYRRISPSEYKRKATYRKQMHEGKNSGNVTQFRGKNVITRHKCAVCGRTELDNDQLEFRFCSKCDGNYEYCMDHLFTHEHVKNSQN